MAATRRPQYSQMTTPPPQEQRRPQSSWFWIFFRCSARGTACPPKCRRRASEGRRHLEFGLGRRYPKTFGEKPHGISRLPTLQNRMAHADTSKKCFSAFHFGETSS